MSTTHSETARKIVLTKGLFDVFLSLSLIFAPALLYDGPIPLIVSRKTGLATPNWAAKPDSAYGLAALIMGCAFAGIKAGRSYSNEAYQTVATLNGVFALTGLLGCYALPRTFGSSFLLLASLQDVFWFSAIILAGNFGVMDTLIGQSIPVLENMKVQAREKARQGIEWSQDAAGRVKESGAGVVQWGQEKANQGMQKGQDAAQWGQQKAQQGAQWSQEKAKQGMQRGQEAAPYGQEKANQGAQWGSEKARHGFENEQEAVSWGLEKVDQGREKAYNKTEDLKQQDREFKEETQPVTGFSYAAAAKQ